MKEFVCIEIASLPEETKAAFSQRLTLFWSNLLRSDAVFFEKVYAECSHFTSRDSRLHRGYAVEPEIANDLHDRLLNAGFSLLRPDLQDLYSQFEIVPPEWMQIEH
ncbi:MAG: hypothetical protein EXR99_00470 [Gemmataceae bacterium]|nr:hypothetical protein [Gemmataceae bacterium]